MTRDVTASHPGSLATTQVHCVWADNLHFRQLTHNFWGLFEHEGFMLTLLNRPKRPFSSVNDTHCDLTLQVSVEPRWRLSLSSLPVTTTVCLPTKPLSQGNGPHNGGLARVLSDSSPQPAVFRAACNLLCPVWQPKQMVFKLNVCGRNLGASLIGHAHTRGLPKQDHRFQRHSR